MSLKMENAKIPDLLHFLMKAIEITIDEQTDIFGTSTWLVLLKDHVEKIPIARFKLYQTPSDIWIIWKISSEDIKAGANLLFRVITNAFSPFDHMWDCRLVVFKDHVVECPISRFDQYGRYHIAFQMIIFWKNRCKVIKPFTCYSHGICPILRVREISDPMDRYCPYFISIWL